MSFFVFAFASLIWFAPNLANTNTATTVFAPGQIKVVN